jgi:poly(A) polymerase
VITQIVESVQNLFGTRRIRKKPRVVTKEEHGIDRTLVSPFAISVCQKLTQAGFKAFIVGGAVRDLLIGHTPKDFDVVTDATPEQVRRLTRRAIIIGRRFRLVHVIRGAEVIEVSTFRGLGQEGVEKDENGRVLDDNVFGEQWEDAARRDFSVNAMFYDPQTEEVLDYHSGLLDIRKKRIRIIGDPEVRYREDPVRILRAIRIASKLDFKIDPKTSAPFEELQKLLLDVPEARLFDEMLKMIASGAALKCVQTLSRYHIFVDLPLIKPLLEAEQNTFVSKALERCDARVLQGRSISPSFVFASLLWPKFLKAFADLKNTKWTAGRKWVIACDTVLDSPATRGIQKRFHKDMREIWMLQPRFERRIPSSAYKLLDHPRFRAAYDFLLIRASSGEVPHALADWWTAFESAQEDEREEMLQEVRFEPHEVKNPSDSEKKPKKRVRRRRKKFDAADSAAEPDVPAESALPESEGEISSSGTEEEAALPQKRVRRRRRHPGALLMTKSNNEE